MGNLVDSYSYPFLPPRVVVRSPGRVSWITSTRQRWWVPQGNTPPAFPHLPTLHLAGRTPLQVWLDGTFHPPYTYHRRCVVHSRMPSRTTPTGFGARRYHHHGYGDMHGPTPPTAGRFVCVATFGPLKTPPLDGPSRVRYAPVPHPLPLHPHVPSWWFGHWYGGRAAWVPHHGYRTLPFGWPAPACMRDDTTYLR